MRRITALVLVPLVFAGAGATAVADTRGTTPELGIRAREAEVLALTGARVVVAPGRILEAGTVIVRDGRVAAVGADVAVPPEARGVDLSGRTLYAGFIDPYTEYGLAAVAKKDDERGRGGARGPQYEGERVGPDAWNDAVHAEQSWVDAFVPDEKAAEELLKRGVTVVQSALEDGIFRGRAFVAALGDGLPGELVLRAESMHWASFDEGSSGQAYPSSLMGAIALVRQTFLDAAWYARAQAALALDPSQDPIEENRALAALAAYDGPFLFATEDALSLLRAARVAAEMERPFVFVGSQGEYRRVEAIAALGRPLVLPLHFPEAPEVGTAEDALDVSLTDLRHWERAPGNAAALAAAGVRFAFTGHGLDEQDFFANLRRAVKRGLAPDVALAALTTVPAELCGVADAVGTIEVGKRADLVAASGDLLTDDEAAVEAVWIDGRLVYEPAPLDARSFAGVYVLTLDDTRYELVLRGRPAKLRGELVADEAEVDLAGVSAERRALRFRAEMDALGGAGIARFSIVDVGGALDGRVVLADGRRARLDVTQISDQPPEPEADEEDDDAGEEGGGAEEAAAETGEEAAGEVDDTALVSRRTWPDLAFGWTDPPRPEDVLVRGATLWTAAADGVVEGADLLVVDGAIAALGRDLEAPEGVRIIDGRGLHVTPGIIDEHSHIAASRGLNEGSHAVVAEVRVGDVLTPESISIYRALAGGVTTAHVLHGSANPIGGQSQVIKLRWGSAPEAMKLATAPPTIKFALGENVKRANVPERWRNRYPLSRMGVEAILRDRLTAARDYAEARARYAALPPEEQARTVPLRRDLQLEALVEVLDGERLVHCHSYVQSEVSMLMQLAEELGFRVRTFTHILEGYKVAAEMAAHGAMASAFSDWWAYKFEVKDAIPYNVCLLDEAGVVAALNSDSSELMRRLNQEAGKAVMYCGMDPERALRLVTLHPALQLGIAERTGSLEPGKDADFVLWNGHPLSVYSRVEQTWIEGALMFSRERDAELRAAAAAERQALVQKVLKQAKEKPGGKKSRGKKDAGAGGGQDAQ